MNKLKAFIYNLSKRLKEWVEDNSIKIAIVSIAYLFWCWFFSAMTSFDKIINVVLVLIPNALLLGHEVSIYFMNNGKSIIPEGLPHFYRKAFSREILTTTINFAKDKNDLINTALFINSHKVFINQFPGPQKRIDLYFGWNKITNNRAIVQVFLPDGKTRIGASVILPLSERGYKRLTSIPKSEQFNFLQNLKDVDVELSNTKACFYLVDILLVDINKNVVQMPEIKHQKLKKYLSGLSLHITLWHIAHIDDREINKLPSILLQPDVSQILHCTYSAAGFKKIDNRGSTDEPVIGDYLEMNYQIASRIKKDGENGKDSILSECLKLLKVYKYEHNLGR